MVENVSIELQSVVLSLASFLYLDLQLIIYKSFQEK